MIPFLGSNRSVADHGKKFLIQFAPQDTWERRGKLESALAAFEKKAKLPLSLRIIRGGCYLFTVIGALGMGGELLEGRGAGLDMVGDALAALFTVGIFWLPGWLISRYGKRRRARVESSEDFQQTVQAYEAVCQEQDLCMEIPESAARADIMSFSYALRKSDILIDRAPEEYPRCKNLEFRLWREGDTLYAAVTGGKFAFPIKDAQIEMVDERVVLEHWNKKDSYRDQYFRDLGVFQDGGNAAIKRYGILKFYHYGEAWGIFFPGYELPTFETLTGLKAE